MMCCIIKAMSMHFIDSKCHIKKMKTCRTGLTGYRCLSSDLLLMQMGIDTHVCTHTNFPDKTKIISINQVHTGLCSKHLV